MCFLNNQIFLRNTTFENNLVRFDFCNLVYHVQCWRNPFYLYRCSARITYVQIFWHKNLNINNKSHYFQAESQIIVSGVNVSRSFIGSLLSTIVLLFVGPWSDYSGRRKPLLILPLVGMSVMSTLVLLMITFPGASTVQVLYAVQIPMSLGGNFGLLLAAAFSYIGDVSKYFYLAVFKQHQLFVKITVWKWIDRIIDNNIFFYLR